MRRKLSVTGIALFCAAIIVGCGAGDEQTPAREQERTTGPPHLRGTGRLIRVADPPWERYGVTYGLQEGLCELEPGDMLEVLRGTFTGPFRIGEDCNDGTADKPI